MNQKTYRNYIMSVCTWIPKPTPSDLLEKYRGRVIHCLENEDGTANFYLQPLELPTEH